MTFLEKIDEWIKEAETRPGSALMILKLIAGRLRDLTERNEELLAENIALQDGSRVEDYQKRIAHLEFQLEILKRRFGSEASAPLDPGQETANLNLLVYNVHGRIFRLAIVGPALGRLADELSMDGEWPRLLAVPEQEELLLLFSSGRISTLPVTKIAEVEPGSILTWSQATMADEPHAGELLVCVMPLSRLPVSDYILQVSRRGAVKKTLSSISEKVLSSHYLGRGTFVKGDQPFTASLAGKKARLVLVTYEGRLIALDVDGLSYSAEERIHPGGLDHVVAGFLAGPDEMILCLTQNGKLIQRESGSLELAKSLSARGQALIPQSRLDQGTRFIGAVPAGKDDSLVILDGEGQISVRPAAEVSGAGSVGGGGVYLALGLLPGGKGADR
jgi:hypothetical protein